MGKKEKGQICIRPYNIIKLTNKKLNQTKTSAKLHAPWLICFKQMLILNCIK